MDANELNFSYVPSSQCGRGCYRASLPGLAVHTEDGTTLEVKDISAGGVGVVSLPNWQPPPVAMLALYVSGKLYVEGLKGTFVQTGRKDVAAYTFVGLSRQQEQRLDKLVLAVQKHLIAMLKARKTDGEC